MIEYFYKEINMQKKIDIVSQIEMVINENILLEDEFIKQAFIQINSYEDFISKYRIEKNIIQRITLHIEDIPKKKYLANI